MRSRRRALFLALLATCLLPALSSCGDKSVVIPPFFEGAIGPGGGHAAAGPCSLDVPPGAFTEDIGVAILPQPTPLPIDPNAGGSTIETMPGLMCIGPLGQPLLVGGHVRTCYSLADLPKGATEADLVLLEWDNAAGFMRVRFAGDPGVTQDLVAHCFDDSAYAELGHIGVGVRTIPFDFVFQGSDNSGALRALGNVFPFQNGLVRADTTGVTPPSPMIGTQGASGYIPSRQGTRLLYAFEGKGVSIDTADVLSGDTRTVSGDDNYESNDPLYGWFETGDRAWLSALRFNGSFGGDYSVVQDVGGSGIPAAADFYDAFASQGIVPRLVDVRVSPDGAMLLLRYTDDDGDGGIVTRFDVVDALTGAAVGTDILDGFAPPATPRWLPDSSALYFVSSAAVVDRIDPDGSGQATLYSVVASPGSLILDFVVSPDYDGGALSSSHCAYVRADGLLVQGTGLGGGPHSVFVVDSLAGGQVASTDLVSLLFVREMAYHPDGATVWADLAPPLSPIGEVLVINPQPTFQSVKVFRAATAVLVQSIVTTMDDLDIDRVGGKALLFIRDNAQDPNFPAAGLYLLGSDGTGQVAVPTPGFAISGPPRWLTSWRHAPGMDSTSQVR